MAAMVPFAVKGTQSTAGAASKALTGDIYTRKWTTSKVVGKGKKKKTVVIDHELKANPVSVGLGLLAVGAAATGVGIAMWLTQRKLIHGVPEGGAKKRYIVKRYYPVYKTVTVVDVPAVPGKPAWNEYRTGTAPNYIKVRVDKNGFSQEEAEAFGIHWVFDHLDERYIGEKITTYSFYHDAEPGTPAETHTEDRVKTAGKTVVMTNRFVPRGSYATFDEAINKMQARHKNPVNLKETRLVWVELRGTKILRHFMEFTTDGNTLGLEGRKGFLE